MTHINSIDADTLNHLTPEEWADFKSKVAESERKFDEAQAVIKAGADYSELWRISPVYTKPSGKVDVGQLARDFDVKYTRLYDWVKKYHPECTNANQCTPRSVQLKVS